MDRVFAGVSRLLENKTDGLACYLFMLGSRFSFHYNLFFNLKKNKKTNKQTNKRTVNGLLYSEYEIPVSFSIRYFRIFI